MKVLYVPRGRQKMSVRHLKKRIQQHFIRNYIEKKCLNNKNKKTVSVFNLYVLLVSGFTLRTLFCFPDFSWTSHNTETYTVYNCRPNMTNHTLQTVTHQQKVFNNWVLLMCNLFTCIQRVTLSWDMFCSFRFTPISSFITQRWETSWRGFLLVL